MAEETETSRWTGGQILGSVVLGLLGSLLLLIVIVALFGSPEDGQPGASIQLQPPAGRAISE